MAGTDAMSEYGKVGVNMFSTNLRGSNVPNKNMLGVNIRAPI